MGGGKARRREVRAGREARARSPREERRRAAAAARTLRKSASASTPSLRHVLLRSLSFLTLGIVLSACTRAYRPSESKPLPRRSISVIEVLFMHCCAIISMREPCSCRHDASSTVYVGSLSAIRCIVASSGRIWNEVCHHSRGSDSL